MYEPDECDDNWTDRSSNEDNLSVGNVVRIGMDNNDDDDKEDDDDKIKIDNNFFFGCNRCFVCEGEYRHSKVITEYADGLQEIEYRISHAKCEKAYKKMQILKQKAIDAEFDFFCLKMTKYYFNPNIKY
jgi:hypothetical protein